MAGAEGVAQAQAHGTLDQERSAQLGAFGNEDPAQCFCLAWRVDRTGNRSRYFGVEVSQIGLGLLGAAALWQVGHDLFQGRVGVQRLEFRLEQILGHNKAGEIGYFFKRLMRLDQCVELLMRLVGDLVQTL